MAITPVERSVAPVARTESQQRDPSPSAEHERQFREELGERRGRDRDRDRERTGKDVSTRLHDGAQFAFLMPSLQRWKDNDDSGGASSESDSGANMNGAAVTNGDTLPSSLQTPGGAQFRLKAQTDGTWEGRLIGGSWDGLSIALTDQGGQLRVRLRPADRAQRSRLQAVQRGAEAALADTLRRNVSIEIEQGNNDEEA
ncbi:hypothetical protein [Paraburkholderia graminis]|uniref:Flagellar hook-length control protein FliK n=1 Tax=Paraburkholderia graminis TaxID=60548 RepID=A0ABD5C7S4_9BURK|nr:hypothetical protein [Paraburkholderia graminis]MDR6201304.1 hypothetical protein [Paraburkholderia graminis]